MYANGIRLIDSSAACPCNTGPTNPCQTPSFVYYCETGANSAPNGAWFFVPVVSQQHPAAVC